MAAGRLAVVLAVGVVLLVVVDPFLHHAVLPAQLGVAVDALGLLVPNFASQHRVDAGFPVGSYFSVLEG